MEQQTYFGFGCISNLKNILKDNNVNNIFLVTGKSSFETSGAKKIVESLLSNYRFYRFQDFSVNPQLSDILKGIELYKNGNYDIIVSVGGGSVIDMAKLINLFSNQIYRPIDYIKKKETKYEPVKLLIAIPTTAGSGSESTHFGVVYIDKIKYSVAHEFLLPNYAIIDPTFTLNLPKMQTAVSGIDALSQAIESYWSINSTEKSKQFSKGAIELIMNNLVNAVTKSNKESREHMAKAANLAGKAINITRTTASHAISYTLTSQWKIPHGHAVALTLGETLIYNSLATVDDINDKRGIDYLKKTISEINKLMNCENADCTADKISELMETIGLKVKLSSLGLEEEDLELITKNVNIERLTNNPRKFTKDSLANLLLKIL